MVLAHVGHWYHALLYLAPVALVAGGLWYAGRKMPDDEAEDGFGDERLDDELPPAS